MNSLPRLVRLLLHLCAEWQPTESSIKIRIPFSRDEISLFIGVSHETLNVYLADLENLNLVQLHGSTLIIPSVHALENYAELADKL
jgi:CRP-like cAMP-binding protein